MFSRLEWRLPLAVALLLLLVSGAMVAMTYAASRRQAVTSAEDRLHQLAELLAQDLDRNATTLRRQAVTSANVPDVVNAFQDPSAVEPLRKRLEAGLAVGSVSSLELWRASGERVLQVPDTGAPAIDPAWAGFPQWAHADRAAMTPPLAGTPGGTYRLAVPVRQGDELLGYVVTQRRVATPSSSTQTLMALIGAETRLQVGSPNGVWVHANDTSSLPEPATIAAGSDGIYWLTDAGDRWIGAMSQVGESDWLLRIEFPAAEVFASSSSLLLSTMGVALLVTALGAGGGWFISRRLIAPLRTLTAAAVQVAEGQESPTLPRSRRDEIGALSDAFDAMTHRVVEGRRDLEARVAERTEALAQALAQAEENARKLEQSNRELEAFSYTISHDLRAPLRGIDGFSEALLTEYRDKLDAQGQNYLMRVRRAAKRMDQLINDLLELAKVSRVELVDETVTMHGLAAKVVTTLRERDPDRIVDVHIEPDVVAQGDARLLSLVLQNLIENAWKFTSGRERGAIAFGVDRMAQPPVYFVRDNGVGFDMAHAHRLFGIFQRLHSLEQFPGTGVGLAIVQRVVQRHGGRIWTESAPEAGATFFFTLEADGGGSDSAR